MSWLQKVRNNPWYIFSSLGGHGLLNWMPDELYLKLAYRGFMGEKLDLKNPRTFNEKNQWLKIHDRNPLYCTLVDKYRVKPWVAERIGIENHETGDTGVPMDTKGNTSTRPIYVGNDVWFRRCKMVVPGAHIGVGRIVAAGAMVTKDLPPYSSLGVPTKVIGWWCERA